MKTLRVTPGRKSSAAPALLNPVTLIVYGWSVNDPGTLSWQFPSLGAAVSAVRAFRNAVRWLIVAGTPKARAPRDEDAQVNVDEVRRAGLVLMEKMA